MDMGSNTKMVLALLSLALAAAVGVAVVLEYKWFSNVPENHIWAMNDILFIILNDIIKPTIRF